MIDLNENYWKFTFEEVLNDSIKTQDVIDIRVTILLDNDPINVIDNIYTVKGNVHFTVKGACDYSSKGKITVMFTLVEDRFTIIEQSTYITIGDVMLGNIDKTITLGMYLKALDASRR